MRPLDVVQLDTVTDSHVTDLLGLFGETWWAKSRGEADVVGILAGSDIQIGLAERDSGRLVAFARVLTDFTYVAMILDVVVRADLRGTGLGARLMEAITTHPRLAPVRSLELVCQPELVEFYRRWGFTDQVGASRLMRRSADPALVRQC